MSWQMAKARRCPRGEARVYLIGDDSPRVTDLEERYGMNAPIAFRACWVLLASLSPCIAANTINVPGDKPTIQAGIDAATDGDVVVVAPGVYAELIDFHGKAITLKSQQGPRVTTIDGQSSGTVITMQTFEGRNSVVQGFTITRGAASFGAGAYLLNSAPTFRQNIFLNNQQGTGGFGAAIAGFNGSPIVDGNEFVGNTCDNQFLSGVLSFVNSSSPQIYNNILRDNDCRAINMTIPTGAAPVTFNNTIVRNRTGIYIDHRVSNASQLFRNNLIAQNNIGLEVAFQFSPFDAIWTNNLVFGNANDFAGTADVTGTNGNLKGDPRFVDGANNNFHLMGGSPAVDAGTAAGLTLPPDDFDGLPRVQDGNGDGLVIVDIGALEAAPAAVLPASVTVDSKMALLLVTLSVLVLAKRRLPAGAGCAGTANRLRNRSR